MVEADDSQVAILATTCTAHVEDRNFPVTCYCYEIYELKLRIVTCLSLVRCNYQHN